MEDSNLNKKKDDVVGDEVDEGAMEVRDDVAEVDDVVVTDQDVVAEAETLETVRGAGSRSKRIRGVKRQRIGGAGSQVSGEEEEEESDPPVGAPALRLRGRPPTTGQYVGLAKAKAALNAAMQEERRLADEKEIAEVSKRTRARSARPLDMASKDALASELRGRIIDHADLIHTIATKSKSLKGTCVKDLKDSSEAIKQDVTELAKRTQSEENQKLQAANERLQADLAAVRNEMVELRQEVQRLRSQGNSAPAVPSGEAGDVPASVRSILEDFKSQFLGMVGEVVNARVDARLAAFSDPAVRPPLASSGAKELRSGSVGGRSVPVSAGPSKAVSNAPRLKAGKKRRKPASKRKKAKRATLAAREAALSRLNVQSSGASDARPPSQAQYTTVVGRKAKQGVSGVVRAGTQSASAPKSKLRPPRTAAVILTLKSEAIDRGVKYEAVLAQAKSQIKLEEIGLSQVRFRTTVTGARMLEIPPGTQDAEKAADALAERLRSVLDADVVHIHRPTKSVDIRVTGLDDSVVAGEVAAAVAEAGGCAVEAVRVGVVARNPDGSGSLWLSCPVVAAMKVVEAGRLKVGWISARVVLLEARPLRCFKCLELGHVGAKCDRGVDRSGVCFRCGQLGHKLRECSADAYCVACAAAGKPAAHYIGRKGCSSGGRARRSAVGGSVRGAACPVALQSTQQEVVEVSMDTAQ